MYLKMKMNFGKYPVKIHSKVTQSVINNMSQFLCPIVKVVTF